MSRKQINLILFFFCIATSALAEAESSFNSGLSACSGAQIYRKYKTCEDQTKPVRIPDPGIDCTIKNGKVEDSRCLNTFKMTQQMKWVKKPDFDGWTGWQRGGLNQDWGCIQVRDQALTNYGKAMRDLNISVRLDEINRGEKSKEVRIRDYEYNYNCSYSVQLLESVQVASEEVIQSVAPLVVTGYELQQNASCGIEDSISVSSSSAPPFFADINEDLQAGRIVPDSVMCTTCSQVEQYGTVVDLANCLVEVETQFRNENGVWGKLTKEDQSAFEDQVNLAYHIASLGGKDPSLALPLKFIKFFFVESNGPGNRKGN